jgi:hypothetical protein
MAGPTSRFRKTASKPPRSGEHAIRPTDASALENGASRANCHGAPLIENCTRTASSWRVTRTETSSSLLELCSGMTDQSDAPLVTTVLKCISPSVYSMPVLIQ